MRVSQRSGMIKMLKMVNTPNRLKIQKSKTNIERLTVLEVEQWLIILVEVVRSLL